MNAKLIALAALAAVGASAIASGDAEARQRFYWRQWRIDPDFGFYRPGPVYVPYPDYGYDDEEDDFEDDPLPRRRYSYAPDDYGPEYAPNDELRPLRRRPVLRQERPMKPVVKLENPKPKLISCKEATGIVTGYGFAAVKPTDCDGASYGFRATRDGKNFSITLNSVSGELTKVKKL